MAETFSFEKPDINLVAYDEETNSRPEPDTPFRIALLGDWGGNGKRHASANESLELRPVLVDRDSFDEVMKSLQVMARLKLDEAEDSLITLRFEQLDDFHPDSIFRRLKLFDRLRETRRRLNHSSTFAEAADEVRSWSGKQAVSEPTELARKQSAPSSTSSTLDGGNLLDQILGNAENERPTTSTSTAPDDFQALLQKLVGPHLVTEDPQQAELVAAVDEATSGLMRSILHHPDFQSLESAWRALYFLVSRAETSTQLKLYLLDISKNELTRELADHESKAPHHLHKLFVEQYETLGGQPWAVLVGNYTFDQTLEDIELLGRLGHLARKARAPFLSAASPHFLGCDSLAKTPDPDDWRTSNETKEASAYSSLRHSAEAFSMGLALPRFLLRLPFGQETEPTEEFIFEEMSAEPEHEDFLWGNPAFACTLLLAQAFSADGWEMRAGSVQEIEGLPLYVYEEQDESRIKPCAEALLSQRAAEAILDAGLMPLLSFKDGDSVRLARFQSIADPAASLLGRWQ